MKIALIDQTGLLTGFDSDDVSPVPDGIEVPEDCDLVVGMARWNSGSGMWQQIAVAQAPIPPNGMAGLYAALVTLQKSTGCTYPKSTQAWLDWFATTLDARGALDL